MNTIAKETDSQIIMTALVKIHEIYGIPQNIISNIIGVTSSKFSKLKNHHNGIDISPESNEGKLALYLIKVFRSLEAIFSRNENLCTKWISNPNSDFNNQTPIDLMADIMGLIRIITYLDYHRGRL